VLPCGLGNVPSGGPCTGCCGIGLDFGL
jgi:hypothetical protein